MGIIDTSNIDATKPTTGTATTQSVRDNFSAINTAFDAVNTRTATNKAAAVLLTPVANAMLFIGGTDGGWFKGVTGSSGYSDNGGAYCGTQFIPTGGDGSAAWVRVDGGYNVGLSYQAVWFGLTETGDTTTHFQAAIDSLPSPSGRRDYSVDNPINGGGWVTLPDGAFSVTSISIPENVKITGQGESTELEVSGSIKWQATQRTNFDACWGIHLEDMHIRGLVGTETLLRGDTYDGAGGKNWQRDILIDATFTRVTFSNAGKGFQFHGGWNNTFDSCKFRNCNVGLELDGSIDTTDTTAKPTAFCDDNLFIRCEFNNCIKSVRGRFAVGNMFIGCAFYTADEYHIVWVDEARGNAVIGGRLEATGTDGATIKGGDFVLHGGSTYRCIADTNGITDAVTEPGVGSSWATYWVLEDIFPARRTWNGTTSGGSMTQRYTPWTARRNIFDGVNLFVGSDPFFGKDGVSIPRSATWSFIRLQGDQYTTIRDCYSGNYTDYNIAITPLSFGAQLYNNQSITASVTSGSPSYYEDYHTFDSNRKTINGEDRYLAGSKVGFEGYTDDIEFVQDTTAPDKLKVVTNSNDAMHVRETTGVVHLPQNAFITTLTASATSTVVSVTNVSSIDVALITPRNAAGATFYGANVGSIYAVPESNDKIRIYHPNTSAGTEDFNVVLL